GKTGFGGWQGYGFYGSSGFTNITPNNQVWSDTWDQGGPGAVKLMRTFANRAFATSAATNNNAIASASENMWGLGAGVILNASGWKINPMLDYAQVVDSEPVAGTKAVYKSAWGGSLMLSTEIDKGTTLLLGGSAVKAKDGAGRVVSVTDSDTMHTVQAAVKMAF
ncbi:MAG: hypothetical protein H7833_21235, partial [Magnetococcus sp. DMHC-1]